MRKNATGKNAVVARNVKSSSDVSNMSSNAIDIYTESTDNLNPNPESGVTFVEGALTDLVQVRVRIRVGVSGSVSVSVRR
jgi:hypothetical protein